MKTLMKTIVAMLYAIGLLYISSGCTESLLPQDKQYALNESPISRGLNTNSYYFYNHENKKAYLTLNTKNAFFSVKEFVKPAILPESIAGQVTKVTDFKRETTKQYSKKTVTDRIYTELSLNKELSDKQYLALLSDFKRQNEGVIVAPYFNDEYGNKIGLSNFFYVKLKKQGDINTLEQMAEQNNCIIVSQDEFMPLWYKLSVTEATEPNALECANLFHESGQFAVAEPDLTANLILSNDQYFSQQWGLSTINIESEWSSSTGNNIIVAVIDQGIDLSHPDLAANIHPLSYDCQTGTAPQQIRGNHGTAVAGIIGATRNNNIGIAGVAPNCRLMSISHSLLANNTSVKEQLARGINWAWQNGADVINCSWSHPTALNGTYITDAISNATSSNGRGGKGCVVVFSSGNDYSSTVNYPANLNNVIAVGAINSNNQRADFSNYGTTLDVVAPGVGIYTTDRQGSNGYYSGDYCSDFTGTSAATPIVSGVAALILSRYPNFTSDQVQEVIKKGCSWLSLYTKTYPGPYPNGPKNNEIGYGMVHASEAMFQAYKEALVEAEKKKCGIDFKITNNTSYDLYGIYICLTGNVGGSNTTLISCDPGGVGAGDIMEGFPNYPGNELTAAAGTAITNLNLELYINSHGSSSQPVSLRVAIDNSSSVSTKANFSGGNTIYISLPDSSIPSEGRRILNIVIE